MKIIDRYVVKEMLGPFLFGACTFTILILSVDTMKRAVLMMMQDSFHFGMVATFVMASIPMFLAYSFPMSSLLASLMAFGRLSGDSEIVAMKAGGISLYRIALPGLLLSLVFAAVAFYLTDRIVPQANYIRDSIALREFYKGDEKGFIDKNFKIEDVAPDGTDRQIIARKVDFDKGILDALTIVFYKGNVRSRVMLADNAVYTADQGWVMNNVITEDLDPSGKDVQTKTTSNTLNLPLAENPQQLKNRPRGRDEMDRRQLALKVRIEKALHNGAITAKALGYMVEYQTRLALPFSCLIFGLFGIPLGLQPHRTSKSIGFGLSIIFLFVFYLLMTFSRTMGENGVLPPLLAAWLPNLIFGGVGATMLVKAGRV